MKKILAVVVCCFLMVGLLTACIDNDKPLSDYDYITTEDSELNTLVMSEIRFDGSSMDAVKKQMISDVVSQKDEETEDREPYELVVFNGNTVNGQNNGKLMKDAISFFDTLGVPYAINLGELDVKGNTSKKDLMKMQMQSKNSIYKKAYIFDDSNYLVQVKSNSGKYVTSLMFMDSSSACSDEQIEWYKNTITNLGYTYADVDGNKVSTMLFCSKALPFFAEKITDKEVTVWEGSDKLQKEVISNKSTKGVFVSHDYENYKNYISGEYSIRWHYTRTMYIPNDLDITSEEFKKIVENVGYTTMTLTSNSSFYPNNSKIDIFKYLNK